MLINNRKAIINVLLFFSSVLALELRKFSLERKRINAYTHEKESFIHDWERIEMAEDISRKRRKINFPSKAQKNQLNSKICTDLTIISHFS